MLPLAGCMTGKAEYAPMAGANISPLKLEQTRAMCRMRLRDSARMETIAYGGVIAPNNLVDDASDCFASQGIRLKGFRQNDGTLTKYPYKGGIKAQ